MVNQKIVISLFIPTVINYCLKLRLKIFLTDSEFETAIRIMIRKMQKSTLTSIQQSHNGGHIDPKFMENIGNKIMKNAL